LTDAEWARLRPLLPPERSGKPGHPYEDHRRVINGILWVLRTGAPWRDLPERYGSWHTCHDRLGRWQRGGRWQHLLQQLQGRADASGELDWEVGFVDSSVVRAHQHAAGARRRAATAEQKGARQRSPMRRSGRAEVG